MFYKNVVVGCGLSGIVMAERIANVLKEPVLIIDKRDHIGGNVYDYKEYGIMIHKYGPHAFHTTMRHVWDYVRQFSQFNTFQLHVSVWIDGRAVPVPFNFNSIEKLFPKFMAEKFEQKLIQKFGYNVKVPIMNLKTEQDEDLCFLADFIYKNVFEGYTIKQWGLKPEEIDSTVMSRVPVFIGYDDRYFQDPFQGIPVNGYTKMFEQMLNNPLISIKLNTEWNDIKQDLTYDRLFFTGSIDEFFDYSEGVLPYRSLRFELQKRTYLYEQPTTTINYPNNYDFTRVCEPKYFLNDQTDHTVLVYEYPEVFEMHKNERYYPVSNHANKNLLDKYLSKARKLSNVYFLGRLGDYSYYNMDQCVDRALKLFSTITKDQ